MTYSNHENRWMHILTNSSDGSFTYVADNPARRFYEALGGQHVKVSQFEIDGTLLDEVAYGWMDIR